MIKRFSKLISGLARLLPRIHVTNRLVPWLTLLAAIIGGSVALYQYSSEVRSNRVISTIEFHKEYFGRADSLVTIRGMLRKLHEDLDIGKLVDKSRCEILNRREDVDVKCSQEDLYRKLTEYSLDLEERKMLRNLIILKQHEEYKTKNVSDRLFRLEGFYSGVITCVNQRACDAKAATAFFAQDMLNFLNAYCSFFRIEAAKWNTEPADNDIAYFLLENRFLFYKSRDESRNTLFFCDHHRKIEAEQNQRWFRLIPFS